MANDDFVDSCQLHSFQLKQIHLQLHHSPQSVIQ